MLLYISPCICLLNLHHLFDTNSPTNQTCIKSEPCLRPKHLDCSVGGLCGLSQCITAPFHLSLCPFAHIQFSLPSIITFSSPLLSDLPICSCLTVFFCATSIFYLLSILYLNIIYLTLSSHKSVRLSSV